MSNEIPYYFSPLFLNLPKDNINFYESKYKSLEEEEAIKQEADCTREFAKQIVFERIHQMRINAIQTIIDKRRCISKIPESSGSMPEMPTYSDSNKRKSRTSKLSRLSSSKKSILSKGEITTTTITKVIEVTEITAEGELIDFSDKVEFEETFLNETNYYRNMHGCLPLTLNRELCNYAQEWANKCAELSALQPRPDANYGENLLTSTGVTIDASAVVKKWYDEKANYDYENPVISENTKYFTQIVWKNSNEVGIGMAARDGKVYVVAYFNPPGNVENEFSENISPLV